MGGFSFRTAHGGLSPCCSGLPCLFQGKDQPPEQGIGGLGSQDFMEIVMDGSLSLRKNTEHCTVGRITLRDRLFRNT